MKGIGFKVKAGNGRNARSPVLFWCVVVWWWWLLVPLRRYKPGANLAAYNYEEAMYALTVWCRNITWNYSVVDTVYNTNQQKEITNRNSNFYYKKILKNTKFESLTYY